jgi:SAM-dependent methyltransferase
MRASNPVEMVALRLGMVPVPLGEAMFGQPLARSVMAGQRLGVFRRLVDGDATAGELATDLELRPEGIALLLDALAALGHLDVSGERYSLSRAARRWLDPASDTYVGTFIEHCFDYWHWWDNLEEVIRTGVSFEIHEAGPDDPHWRRYIVGQFELARLSAPEVARSLRLGRSPRKLLDVAGAHGWFSAELCRRHPGLEATVLDLPGSAAIGRELIAEAGMSDRVRHVEGDMFESDLGGPYDGALLFNIVHHLSPEDNVRLLRRVRESLAPGGKVAVLDLFTPPAGKRPDAAAFLGLFFHLTSGAGTYGPDELREWLAEAGFGKPRRVRIRRIPAQTLYEAESLRP